MYLKLKHKSLRVWHEAMDLTYFIFSITEDFPRRVHYGLASHLRKTATSVVSNISEGASRSSTKERRRFYEIARSSLVELDTQLEISQRAGYLKGADEKEISDRLYKVFMLLTRLMEATNK